MKSLRVALIHRKGIGTLNRTYGPWSYDVPEFIVSHVEVGKGFGIRKDKMALERDIIVYEDGKLAGRFLGESNIPVIYVVVDSTLSDIHYRARYEEAKQANLVLVDHDLLSRFAGLHRPVERFSYCINDQLFKDYSEEKTVDICFHAHFSEARWELHEWLTKFCSEHGFIYASGKRQGEDYARAFNRAKITINLNRTPDNRAHRVLDAMACRSCVLTSPLPYISGEYHLSGTHFAEFQNMTDLPRIIKHLLSTGNWKDVADAGYDLAHSQYTWATRAKQLYTLLLETFPYLLKERT